MKKEVIKNIIFDFGGVVFRIDEVRTVKAFAHLFNCSPEDVYSRFAQDSKFLDYECGRITTESFLNYLMSMTDGTVSRKDIIAAWNAILVEYPQEHIQLLLKLREKYHIYLLSNTNALHTEEFPRIAKRQNLPITYNHEIFEKVWYSNEVKMRKPDVEIFKFALQDANIKPEETLFVDDLQVNVEAASLLKINTCRITKEQGILKLFEDWV